MKELVLTVHSVVDVITNSSTVIYTEAASSSIETAKAIIDDILVAAGSDKRADDLFDFAVKVLPGDAEDWVLEQGDSLPDGLDEVIRAANGWSEKCKVAREWIADNRDEFEALFDGMESEIGSYGNDLVRKLIVTTKGGEEYPLASKCLKLFHQDASYDG